MRFKRITSTILSAALMSGIGNSYAINDSTAQRGSDAVIRRTQNNGQKENTQSEKLSILKDPVCLAILAAGGTCLAYGLYHSIHNSEPTHDNRLPAEFIGFDWERFSETCRLYAHHMRVVPGFVTTDRVHSFYEEHIRLYMHGESLNLGDFVEHIINHHIFRRQLELWESYACFTIMHQQPPEPVNEGNRRQESSPVRGDGAHDAHEIWAGYDWQRFKNVFKKCHQLVTCGHGNDLPIDTINYYNNLKDFLCTHYNQQIRQLSDSEIARTISEHHIEKADLDNWISTIELLTTSIPPEHFLSQDVIESRNRFIDGMNRVNLASGERQLRCKIKRSLLSCERSSGWHVTPLDPSDTDIDVMGRRIDNLFGTTTIRALKSADLRENSHFTDSEIREHTRSTPNASFRDYVFGVGQYYHDVSRYQHLQEPGSDSDPEKLILFARYLKTFENASDAEKRALKEQGLGIIKDSHNMCGNELSQIIDNLAMTMDTIMPDTDPISNAQQLVEKAITTAKRNSLKTTSNITVEEFCDPGAFTAEYQKNLYAKLAPIFGISNSKPFLEYENGGPRFTRWINNPDSPEFNYLCDTFLRNCLNGISTNTSELLNGLNEEQIANLKNEMLQSDITYSDFEKIISSPHVSNQINLHKDSWLNMESARDRDVIRQKLETKNFSQRFDDFVNEIFDDEDKAKLQDWKNHPTAVTLQLGKVIECTGTYYQNYLPELTQYNGKKPDLWFADILVHVYLHNNGNGMISVE